MLPLLIFSKYRSTFCIRWWKKNWLLVPPSVDAFQMLMKTCSVATKHKWIRSTRFKLLIQDKTFPLFSQYSSGPAGVYEEWGTLGFRSQAPWLPHQSEASGLHTHKLVVLRSLILCLILSVWCGTLRTGPLNRTTGAPAVTAGPTQLCRVVILTYSLFS